VRQDEPQVGVDRAGVLGGDLARARVDVQVDHAEVGLMLAQRLERSAGAGDQLGVAGDERAQAR
jgi:hypothetical protein